MSLDVLANINVLQCTPIDYLDKDGADVSLPSNSTEEVQWNPHVMMSQILSERSVAAIIQQMRSGFQFKHFIISVAGSIKNGIWSNWCTISSRPSPLSMPYTTSTNSDSRVRRYVVLVVVVVVFKLVHNYCAAKVFAWMVSNDNYFPLAFKVRIWYD